MPAVPRSRASPRGRSRRQCGPRQELQRAGHHVVAGAAVIVERDGRQHDRHRRGGRGGARQPEVVEIGAQRVEDVLVEDHAGPGRDIGRRRQDQRTPAAAEIGIGRAVEEDLVVQVGRELRAPPVRRRQSCPVTRIEGAGDDLALHVALQEALLVFREQLVAVQAIGQRREAAARDPGDDADGIEQANLLAARPNDLGASGEIRGRRTKRPPRACRPRKTRG